MLGVVLGLCYLFVRSCNKCHLFLNNLGLFFNKVPLPFNTRHLLDNKRAPSWQIIPTLGTKYFHLGNEIFPGWENIISNISKLVYILSIWRNITPKVIFNTTKEFFDTPYLLYNTYWKFLFLQIICHTATNPPNHLCIKAFAGGGRFENDGR